MKLIGYRFYDGYYIDATLACPSPLIHHDIMFRIDTGCDYTTINLSDNRFFNIDYNGLSSSPSLTVSGKTIDSYSIHDCLLTFMLDNCMLVEQLDKVFLLIPPVEDYEKMMHIPSLLGLDVLKRYSISFDDNYVYLEK